VLRTFSARHADKALETHLIDPPTNVTIRCLAPIQETTMSCNFETAQDAEDAYYDALEDGDLDALLSVWAETDEVCCLLPMHPLAQGRSAVRDAFARLLARGQGIALSVKHLGWIDAGEMVIHLVEESPQQRAPGTPPVAVYGTNVYRRGADGWRLVVHQNAPTAPPGRPMPPTQR
jgi:ketosteroid isomerase-like protein